MGKKTYPQKVKIIVSANIDDTEFYVDDQQISYVSSFSISHNIDKGNGGMPEVSITFYPDEVEFISENKDINKKFIRKN